MGEGGCAPRGVGSAREARVSLRDFLRGEPWWIVRAVVFCARETIYAQGKLSAASLEGLAGVVAAITRFILFGSLALQILL